MEKKSETNRKLAEKLMWDFEAVLILKYMTTSKASDLFIDFVIIKENLITHQRSVEAQRLNIIIYKLIFLMDLNFFRTDFCISSVFSDFIFKPNIIVRTDLHDFKFYPKLKWEKEKSWMPEKT